ncbi:Borealin [Operophtera brumata]|uniref:Borealin n=1 Tax=Operophtera brumata TaxID=104452 RepID=A0A0L7L7Y1_OPEBR|nr:Borealin [Operophtera brumata]
MEIRNVELAFKILVGSINSTYMQQTIGQLGSRSRSADPASRKLPPTASKTVQRRRSRSVYRTPAYNKGATCNYPAITPKVSPTLYNARRARSVYRTPAYNKGATCNYPAITPKVSPTLYNARRSRSVYRTPAYNKGATCNYPSITPKPRQGEMVVSMAGSPVMVPSCYA